MTKIARKIQRYPIFILVLPPIFMPYSVTIREDLLMPDGFPATSTVLFLLKFLKSSPLSSRHRDPAEGRSRNFPAFQKILRAEGRCPVKLSVCRHDLTDATLRHTDLLRQTILRDAHRLQEF